LAGALLFRFLTFLLLAETKTAPRFLVARKIIQTKNKIQMDHGAVRLSVQWIKVKPVQGLGSGFRNFSSAAAQWPNGDLVPFKFNSLHRRNEWANGHQRSRVARLPSPLKAKE
jgi:hypothetical protein